MDLKLIGTLARAGFAFAPTDAGMTHSRRIGWADMATSDVPTIKAWLAAGDSLVSAATHNSQYIVDIDDPFKADLLGFKMEWLDGMFLVDSPSGGIHAYGLHDATSNALPGAYINVRAEKNDKKSPLIVELKLHHASTAAPSVHRVGVKGKKDGIYRPRGPFTSVRRGIHPELLAWILANADDRNTSAMVGRFKGFHPDFDIDHMLENEGCSEVKQGMIGDALHVEIEECPHCGKKCAGSTLAAAITKFIFGGTGVGFICHACGIDTFEDHAAAMRSKDSNYAPWMEYEGNYIYKVDDPAELAKIFKVEDVTNEPDGVLESDELESILNGPAPSTDGLLTVDVEENEDWKREFVVRTANSIPMTEITWLWPDKIPCGMTTIINGKQGSGKSLFFVDFMARLTTCRDWPDGSKNETPPSRVLYCTTEDDPNNTTIPRLVAAGADLSKVLFPERITTTLKEGGEKQKEHLDIDKHILSITRMVLNNPDIRAIIFDPLVSYIGGTNIMKDEEIRPLMDKLAAVGRKTGVAVLCLVHSSKRSDVDALGKVMGAQSLTGSARVVWTFGKDADDETLHRMGIVKGNVIAKKTGLEYHIISADVDINGKKRSQPLIQWGAESNKNADDMLQADRAKARNSGEDSQLNLAIACLRETVPGYAVDGYRKAEAEGVSKKTLERAKAKLGVKSGHKTKGDAKWWWYIPGEEGDPLFLREKLEEAAANEVTIPEVFETS